MCIFYTMDINLIFIFFILNTHILMAEALSHFLKDINLKDNYTLISLIPCGYDNPPLYYI